VSIKVMNLVFERYPVGGNEGMLALALADHAHDDGTRIWPSLDTLAKKTKQSRSSVRRHLKGMTDSGWLVLVRQSDGRAGGTNEYRIHPGWIAGTFALGEGVNLTPSPDAVPACDLPVDNSGGEGVNLVGEGITAVVGEGVTAVVPESSGTVRNSQYPLTPVGTGDVNKKPGTGQPKGRAGKPPWRWRESFDGYRKRGEQLGVPYSQQALGTAWTDDQLLAHQRDYRQQVDQADGHAGGGP
jgi:hypothetical protein